MVTVRAFNKQGLHIPTKLTFLYISGAPYGVSVSTNRVVSTIRFGGADGLLSNLNRNANSRRVWVAVIGREGI